MPWLAFSFGAPLRPAGAPVGAPPATPRAQRRSLAASAEQLGREALSELKDLGHVRHLDAFVSTPCRAQVRRGPLEASSCPPSQLRRARSAHGEGNRMRGHTRIRGALHNLGHDVPRNTIKRILLEAGMEPRPRAANATLGARTKLPALGSQQRSRRAASAYALQRQQDSAACWQRLRCHPSSARRTHPALDRGRRR
jgi:hypothetical protein